MSDNYDSNPQRGCGRKVPGGYYAEGRLSSVGILNAWTNVFGVGVIGQENGYLTIPPRKGLFLNPASSLLLSSLCTTEINHPKYQSVVKRTTPYGYFDHVGKTHYTAHQFVEEVKKYGPSRRITPAMATGMVNKTPIPVFFTHSRVPIFHSISQIEIFLDLLSTVIDFRPKNKRNYATWLDHEWSLYSKGKSGNDHSMGVILSAIDVLDRWLKNKHLHENEYWIAIRAFVKNEKIKFMEQVFGATWITHISYVAKSDDSHAKLSEIHKKGINVLELGDD